MDQYLQVSIFFYFIFLPYYLFVCSFSLFVLFHHYDFGGKKMEKKNGVKSIATSFKICFRLVQWNFSGSNTFGTMKISWRQG